MQLFLMNAVALTLGVAAIYLALKNKQLSASLVAQDGETRRRWAADYHRNGLHERERAVSYHCSFSRN